MKIVVLDGYTLNPGDNPWDEIETLGTLEVHDRTPHNEIAQRAAGADVILTNKTKLPAEILDELPDLKYISVLATGYDVVDVNAAAARGIAVSNVPGYSTPAVAQHVMALLLELASRTGDYDASTKNGDWSGQPDFCNIAFGQTELAGKTLGIIGFGGIGQEAARLGHAFGMRILAHAPRPKPQPQWGTVEFADLGTVFAESDAISLHCPQTEENKEFVNAALLARMKPSAFIINTARGTLINEGDLAKALEAGTIAGAGLDVLAQEPPAKDNPLMRAPNCLITPHVAWATLESRQRLMKMTADNIRAFANGAPTNVVNGVS